MLSIPLNPCRCVDGCPWPPQPSTTVLVLSPGVAGDFSTFMDEFLEPGIATVEAMGLSERIQLVPFHPKAQYSEVPDVKPHHSL